MMDKEGRAIPNSTRNMEFRARCYSGWKLLWFFVRFFQFCSALFAFVWGRFLTGVKWFLRWSIVWWLITDESRKRSCILYTQCNIGNVIKFSRILLRTCPKKKYSIHLRFRELAYIFWSIDIDYTGGTPFRNTFSTNENFCKNFPFFPL